MFDELQKLAESFYKSFGSRVLRYSSSCLVNSSLFLQLIFVY
ncbi:recombinase RecF [Rickettsia sp. R2]